MKIRNIFLILILLLLANIAMADVPVTGVSLSRTTISFDKNTNQYLYATIAPSNATNKNVTWTSSNTSIATVSSSGIVSAVNLGTCTITVTTVDGGFTATCEVTVTVFPVTGITLNKTTITLNKGNGMYLTATISPSNATDKTVIWSSSNTSVATVDAWGFVRAVNPGTCTITARTNDGGFIATCQVNVPALITKITLNMTTISLNKNTTENLTATISPPDDGSNTVSWFSSNTSVATVNSSGLVTAVGDGDCTITAITSYFSNNATATCQVNVYTIVATGLSLNKTTLSLNKGTLEALVPIIFPSNASNKAVTWSSSDNNIATVDANGIVTAVETGNCDITATTVDGGFTATCHVNVKAIAVDNVGGYDTAGWAYDIATKNNYAYLADGDGLVVFDTSNPSSPLKVGEVASAGDMCSVAVSGNYAYAASWDAGLGIFDISNPANPQSVGAYNTISNASAIVVSGDFAYVADTDAGLEIFNVSDPANPVRVGGYNNGGFACAVAVSGNYAYVTDYVAGLVIIDISDPANPQKVSEYSTFGVANGIAVVGNYVYLADSESGLVILDVTNPENPNKVGGFDYDGYAYDVTVAGKYAYIADFDSGLVIFDVSDPLNPKMFARCNTAGNANSVSLVGNYIYLTEGDAGVSILGVGNQIKGKISLANYCGDLTKVMIKFGLIQNGSELWNSPISIDGSGNFTVPYIMPGNYDLSFKGSHWLRKIVSGINIE